MRLIVLGAAAGGGLPQWNCGCPLCDGARRGRVRSRTQASLAVSGDGRRWALLNASPDVRAQIEATPALQPRAGSRESPISDVVLTSGDTDCVAGLLTMRESPRYAVHGTSAVLDGLARNPIFPRTERREIALERPFDAAGIAFTAFPAPGKAPLWRRDTAPPDPGHSIGLEFGAGGKRVVFLPACGMLTPEIARRLDGAALALFDGTLWRDDELTGPGLGPRSGEAMGHMSLSGPEGSLAALARLKIGRLLFIHLNNTNPALDPESAEAAAVRRAGFAIAEEGQEIAL